MQARRSRPLGAWPDASCTEAYGTEGRSSDQHGCRKITGQKAARDSYTGTCVVPRMTMVATMVFLVMRSPSTKRTKTTLLTNWTEPWQINTHPRRQREPFRRPYRGAAVHLLYEASNFCGSREGLIPFCLDSRGVIRTSPASMAWEAKEKDTKLRMLPNTSRNAPTPHTCAAHKWQHNKMIRYNFQARSYPTLFHSCHRPIRTYPCFEPFVQDPKSGVDLGGEASMRAYDRHIRL